MSVARNLRVAATILAALVAAGCGYHLQGTTALPAGVRHIYVATRDELSPFAVELRRSLDASGAAEAPSAGVADVVIRVLQDRTGRRVLSVSSRNTPQEYEIYYSVQFAIERGQAQAVAPQSIELTRSYSFSESDVLAKDREEAILREAMARDLADLVLRRLGSL